jgi:hypothetical protein
MNLKVAHVGELKKETISRLPALLVPCSVRMSVNGVSLGAPPAEADPLPWMTVTDAKHDSWDQKHGTRIKLPFGRGTAGAD